MRGGAGLGKNPLEDLTCDNETGVDLMMCQLRERLLIISQCIVDTINVTKHNEKIERICTTEGIYLQGDVSKLEKRVKDAYEMLKGMVERLPGNAENFNSPKFYSSSVLLGLTTAYDHFKSLIDAIKPVMVTTFPIYSDEYVRFLNTAKAIVNKLQTTFLESMTEERAQTKQLSREAAEFHNEERKSLQVMKQALNSQVWHKAQRSVNLLSANLEKRRSQLPSGGPRVTPGAPGLMGAVVTPPKIVAPAYIPNVGENSWARASPVARKLVPAGGRKSRKTRRSRY
jgi:hypothetical protein